MKILKNILEFAVFFAGMYGFMALAMSQWLVEMGA